MKVLGYFLKGISIFIIMVLIFISISSIKRIVNHLDEDASFVFGYIFGIVLGISGMGWATISLLKYSNKLITKANHKDEISTIDKK
jgi:divalent metal cation (Fe/Co/Zn/Cd) transporter